MRSAAIIWSRWTRSADGEAVSGLFLRKPTRLLQDAVPPRSAGAGLILAATTKAQGVNIGRPQHRPPKWACDPKDPEPHVGHAVFWAALEI